MSSKVVALLIVGIPTLLIFGLWKLTLRKPTSEEIEKRRDRESKIGISDVITISYHILIPIIGFLYGLLKLVYDIWKHSPTGSSAKFWTGSILAFSVAIFSFMLIKLIDLVINRSSKQKLTPEEEKALGYNTEKKKQEVFIAGKEIASIINSFNSRQNTHNRNGDFH